VIAFNLHAQYYLCSVDRLSGLLSAFAGTPAPHGCCQYRKPCPCATMLFARCPMLQLHTVKHHSKAIVHTAELATLFQRRVGTTGTNMLTAASQRRKRTKTPTTFLSR
jgi:hypothetical protein